MSLSTPDVRELSDVVAALHEWQHDTAALQLHPGDLGWFWRFGADKLAASMRIWRRDGRIVAMGLLDETDLIRLTAAPDVLSDKELARTLAADVSQPEHGVLGDGEVCVEVPTGAAIRDVLLENGWQPDEPWTPLRHDLTDIADVGLRIEVVGPDLVATRTAIQRASFERSTFTDERWHAMADGAPYAEARCLLGYDGAGEPVAAVTVWAAGPGRPGLLEPLGVHREHRGHGYGTAISHAAARALHEMGATSALVCTPSSNEAAVATYAAAGFARLPERFDLRRAAL